MLVITLILIPEILLWGDLSRCRCLCPASTLRVAALDSPPHPIKPGVELIAELALGYSSGAIQRSSSLAAIT